MLTGCGTYSRYHRAGIRTENLYWNLSVDIDTTNIASMSWREMFTDRELQSLIEAGLEQNTDLNVARLRVEAAEAALITAKLSYLPSLGINAEGGGSRYDRATAKTYNVGATASWELDIFGKLTAAKRGAVAAWQGSRDYQQAVQTQLIATIADSYYTLAMLDEQMAINNRTLENWRATVRTLEALKKVGKANEAGVLQAKANVMQLESSQLAICKSISETENALSAILAMPPQPIERSSLAEASFPDTISIGVPLQLLSNRPDVRQAEQKLIAANAAVGIAYTNMFPRLSLTAQYGLESEEMSDLLKSPIHYLSANLLGPIFAMGKNRAIVKAKKAAYEQECYSYEKSVLTAFKDARNAIVDFNKIKEIYESRLQLERSSKTNMELAQLQYINGVIGYLDVLDAQRSYFDAQIGLSNAVRDKQITMVRLYKALGGGWQ